MTAKLTMQIDTTKNTAILFPVLTDSSLFTLLFCVAKTLFLLTPSVAEVTACTSGIKIFVVSSIFDFEVAVAFVLSGLVAVLFTFIATISRVILHQISGLHNQHPAFIILTSKFSGKIASKDTFSTVKSLVLVTLNVRSISSFD